MTKFVVQISIYQGLPSNQLQEFDPLRGRIDHFWRDAFNIVVKTEEINTQQKKLRETAAEEAKISDFIEVNVSLYVLYDTN